MRFRTRAFLLCFVPFAFLLTGSFWAIQKLVKSTVREGLRTSLRENHVSIARLRGRSDLQNNGKHSGTWNQATNIPPFSL